MLQVRSNIFETNSSSTHSMVLTTEEKMKKWEIGKLYYAGDSWGLPENVSSLIDNDGFIDSDVLYEGLKNEYNDEDSDQSFDEYVRGNYSIFTYDDWGYGFDTDTNSYTTLNGEKMATRCYYGYDG